MYTKAECIKKYGSQYNVDKVMEKGKIYRVDRGIYSENQYVPELGLLAFKYPNAIVTMKNAWFIHGLTDVIPEEYDFATDRNASKITDKRIKQYFYSKDILTNGVIEMEYEGYPIKIYDKERMLVELIRYKTKLPFDYYKEIILNYRRILPELDIRKVEDYTMLSPKSQIIMKTLQLEVF